ncbi:MAG: hypothetical protein ACM3VS_02480 [Candidatus Dadabacteria bacterium]
MERIREMLGIAKGETEWIVPALMMSLLILVFTIASIYVLASSFSR